MLTESIIGMTRRRWKDERPFAGHTKESLVHKLQNNAVHILYCMIVSEFHENGHFDDIENELVGKLDTIFMSDSKGDDVSRAFFIGHLRDQISGIVVCFLPIARPAHP